MTRLLSLLVLTAFLTMPALAAEEKKAEDKPAAKTEEPAKAKKEEASAAKKEVTPISKWIDAENAMIDPLNDLDKESIFILRQKHSIIRVIGVVERDIGAAVKSCAKANPDLKKGIENRFTQWKNAVDPVVETARKNLAAEIDKQTIVDEKQFKKVLRLNDEAFEYGDKKTTKNPVSSKEACENLIDSMDDTEDEMVSLLQDTLLPPSVIKSRVHKARSESEKKNFSKNAE